MALPLSNVRDIMQVGSNLSADRDTPVRLAIAVEIDTADPLLVALEEVLTPRTATASCDVGVVGESAPQLRRDTDVVVGVLGGGSPAMVEYLESARALDIRVVTILLEGEGTATAGRVRQPLDDFLTGRDAETLVREHLGAWLADRMPKKRLALAAGFDFLRSCVANEFVKSTAWQNALIGGVVIIPGADMPLMTGNQAKMVLQIAAAYGEKLDTERAKELLAVVGGGFAFRAIARQLLDLVPGFGWALKAGIGYTGTIAMGKAAILYFEDGADLGTVVAQLRTGAAAVADRVKASRQKPELTAGDPVDGVPYKLEASHGDVAGS